MSAKLSLVAAHESSLETMFSAWASYAGTHKRMYDTDLAEDYVLGPQWVEMGRCLIGLLNGVTGKIDCGNFDRNVRKVALAAGFDQATVDNM